MAIVRQLIFSMSLEEDIPLAGFYSYDLVLDGNPDGASFSCAYCPSAKEGVIAMQPITVFLGTVGSTSMLETFVASRTMDGENNIDAYAVTNLMAPTLKKEEPFELVRFINIEMSNINALSKGVVVEYSIDAESPNLISPVWEGMHYSPGETRAFFPRAVGRWVHLKITDGRDAVDEDIWGGFAIGYYPLGTRTGEAST